MKKLACLAVFATLGMSSLAHAEGAKQKAQDAALIGGVVGSPIATVVFGATDLTAAASDHEMGKIYGGVELGVNAVLAVDMTIWAVQFTRNPLDHDGKAEYWPAQIAAGMAACNLILAVHGGYLLATQEHNSPMLAVSVGHVHGVVTPATVSDGIHVGGGAMVGGTF